MCVCACLPVIVDGTGRDNPEIQENAVLADPKEKDPIKMLNMYNGASETLSSDHESRRTKVSFSNNLKSHSWMHTPPA